MNGWMHQGPEFKEIMVEDKEYGANGENLDMGSFDGSSKIGIRLNIRKKKSAKNTASPKKVGQASFDDLVRNMVEGA